MITRGLRCVSVSGGRCMSSKMVMSRSCVAIVFIVGLVGLNQTPQRALAQSAEGIACMFNAPSGALDLGHVGWGILDPVADVYYFGATENTQGSPSVPPGGNDQTWLASGTWNDMLTAFVSAAYFHSVGYYTLYRCSPNLVSYNVSGALAVQAQGAGSGYNLLDDNCLTKSVAIFNAYILDLPALPSGEIDPPNFYFNSTLTDYGWDPVEPLFDGSDPMEPPELGCMFNAPTGATVGAGLGQVGWGFMNSITGNWTFGATENFLGNFSVPPGGNTQSWMASGSQNDMFAAFVNSSYYHPANYYSTYLCNTVAFANVTSALNSAEKVASSGYDFGDNNCLTKAVTILGAYGETSLDSLPGYEEAPNVYFNNLWTVGWPDSYDSIP